MAKDITKEAEEIFLPDDYEVPSSGNNYMKFENGENRFRILGKAILGWEYWVSENGRVRQRNDKPQQGDKPVRVRADGSVPEEAMEVARHFWAMPVWNYKEQQVQILEITQKGIQKAIRALSKNKDWGSPRNYDISVIRTGEGLDTEYEVIPAPPKPLPSEAKEALEQVTINLEALYDGGDPFQANLTDKQMDEIDKS